MAESLSRHGGAQWRLQLGRRRLMSGSLTYAHSCLVAADRQLGRLLERLPTSTAHGPTAARN